MHDGHSYCRRCGRHLKREPYATLGIGKICKQKLDKEMSGQNESDSDLIIPYIEGQDIFIRRRLAPTLSSKTGQIELMRHTCSGIETNVQRLEYLHSPSGFNFGYGGSGPADLALNILLMFTDKETAHAFHQDFKFKYCTQSGDELVIKLQAIKDYIRANRK